MSITYKINQIPRRISNLKKGPYEIVDLLEALIFTKFKKDKEVFCNLGSNNEFIPKLKVVYKHITESYSISSQNSADYALARKAIDYLNQCFIDDEIGTEEFEDDDERLRAWAQWHMCNNPIEKSVLTFYQRTVND